MLNRQMIEMFFNKRNEYKRHLHGLKNNPIGINADDPHDETRQTVQNKTAIEGTQKILEVISDLENEYWKQHNV